MEEYLTIILVIIRRGLEVSIDLMTPVAIALYVIIMGIIYAAYYRRGSSFGALIHIVGGCFTFFVIWNHPAYSYYKHNPWNGGYIYALIMIVTYVYVPMKLAVFTTEICRQLFRPVDRL